MLRSFGIIGAVAGLAVSSSALAQDLFQIRLTEVSNPTNTQLISGSNVIDLVDNAINTNSADIARFSTLNTDIRLNYAGVQDAIIITKNAGNTSATLQFNVPGATATRTFTGAIADELQNQIEDYLKSDGGDDVRDFIRAINKASALGVSDGNPNSTTARLGGATYDRFGRYSMLTAGLVRGDDGNRVSGGLQLRGDVQGGVFNAGNFDGTTVQAVLTGDVFLSERVGTSFGFIGGYSTVEGANVYHVGAELGIPFRLVVPSATENKWLWQLTPSIVVGAAGSEEFASGGLIWGGGLTSQVVFQINEAWTFAVANQITFYEGAEVEIDDISIDPGVSQQLAKNGVQVGYAFSERWTVFGGVDVSNYLNDAAVEWWLTPHAGLRWQTRGGSGVQLGVSCDFGDDYEAYLAKFIANLAF